MKVFQKKLFGFTKHKEMKKVSQEVVQHAYMTGCKIFSSCGILSVGWAWIGQNHLQLNVLFGFVCMVLAILSYKKGKK